MSTKPIFEDLMNVLYVAPTDVQASLPFLIRPVRMGCNHPNRLFEVQRGREYPYFTLHIVFSGSSFFEVENKEYLLKKGDAFIITSGQKHRYYNAHQSNLGLLWVELDCSGYYEIINWLKAHQVNVLDYTQTEQLTIHLTNLLRYTTTSHPPDAFILSGMCYTLIMSLYSALDPATLRTSPPTLTSALHYIAEHFKENLTIPELARHLHISSSTLTKQFKTYIGTSPAHYILLKKVEHAVFLLKSTTQSCDTIAETCGFYDATHLYKVFIKFLGVPPTAMRQQILLSAE